MKPVKLHNIIEGLKSELESWNPVNIELSTALSQYLVWWWIITYSSHTYPILTYGLIFLTEKLFFLPFPVGLKLLNSQYLQNLNQFLTFFNRRPFGVFNMPAYYPLNTLRELVLVHSEQFIPNIFDYTEGSISFFLF